MVLVKNFHSQIGVESHERELKFFTKILVVRYQVECYQRGLKQSAGINEVSECGLDKNKLRGDHPSLWNSTVHIE